ncbi:MAG TPA: ORF6N domain-containing protein [Victivallales bacterium]|nr:ORF6N domain-containing protein [Victivallales bacterium]
MGKSHAALVPIERIENKILLIRGLKVLLDRDLADFYGVTTGNLNKAVTRNIDRFPEDFMFNLSNEEADNLIFQNGRSSWGGTRKVPRVFTEQGVAMLSGVLKSQRAVKMNIAIMRAFVRMREMLLTNEKMARRLKDIEERMDKQEIHTIVIMDKLRALTTSEKKKQTKIGFIQEP